MSKKQTKKQGRAAAMPLSQIIKKINKENAPPGGWRPEDKATSFKRQASSLTVTEGWYRIQIERNNMDNRVYGMTDVIEQIKRVADALEEVLRLVKADQEKMEHINLKEKYASLEPDPNEEN